MALNLLGRKHRPQLFEPDFDVGGLQLEVLILFSQVSRCFRVDQSFRPRVRDEVRRVRQKALAERVRSSLTDPTGTSSRI